MPFCWGRRHQQMIQESLLGIVSGFLPVTVQTRPVVKMKPHKTYRASNTEKKKKKKKEERRRKRRRRRIMNHVHNPQKKEIIIIEELERWLISKTSTTEFCLQNTLWDFFKRLNRLTHVCNPRTGEAETGDLQICGKASSLRKL